MNHTAAIATTLNRIREHGPCTGGWQRLLEHLGKTKADDEQLPFAVIVEANGLQDALWCCRAEPKHNKKWRLFAVWCARQVEHLVTDPRSVAALDVAERYAHGKATLDELLTADSAADSAARAAARAAAESASMATADSAAWAAARAASWAASWAASRAASRAAAAYAAGAAANDAAAYAARAAAWAASWAASRDAAEHAAKAAQRAEFLRVVGGEL